jgi:hypothetical protein
MPPLTDPQRTQWYLNALESWDCDGYVVFEEHARNWLRAAFPAYSARQFGELLYQHVQDHGCGCVDEQPETREHWRDLHEFHHDLRVRIVYFETRLIILKRQKDSYILVVSAHDP